MKRLWFCNSAALGVALVSLLSGCITVYQPLVGLQRPVAIEAHPENFKGVRLQLNCIPGDYVGDGEAELLCEQLQKLFTSQGAIVRTSSAPGTLADDDDGLSASAGPSPTPAAGAAPELDLQVDLSARVLHEEHSPIRWALCIATLTLVPAMNEHLFAQDIAVRDAQGFLLATDSWQGRFVRYFGVAVWGVNFLLDRTLRSPNERLTGTAPGQDFSRDYYRQLTQLVFNAKSRLALLAPPPGPEPKPSK